MLESLDIKRLDHHGIVASVMKELGIISMIDQRVGIDSSEEITTGEAIAAMVINGLGFSDRPLMLTPQFFENIPVELLFQDGVEAKHFNRHKLGRALDKISDYGTTKLFSELSISCAQQECIGLEKISIDTTSHSFEGEYDKEFDVKEVKIVHGYSKDKRPDLKQVVQDLIVSCDEGIPIGMRNWDGNSSDNVIFEERCRMIKESFSMQENTPILIADSKLYSLENAKNLSSMKFVTRIPETIKEAKKNIEDAIMTNNWKGNAEIYYCPSTTTDHYGIKQKWTVYYSKEGLSKARKTIEEKIKKEKESLEKDLFHLQAKRFGCEEDAKEELSKIYEKWKYHFVGKITIKKIAKYPGKGRPKIKSTPKKHLYQISSQYEVKENIVDHEAIRKACFIIATNQKTLGEMEILELYKQEGHCERGFRFLKSPHFFTSAFFLKSNKRIDGLLMVMTLALLVYSIAQRRLRRSLKQKNETIPNQINRPIQNPTMRWIFQIFSGINAIKIKLKNVFSVQIQGLQNLHVKILKLIDIKHLSQLYAVNSES
jgi:transposase